MIKICGNYSFYLREYGVNLRSNHHKKTEQEKIYTEKGFFPEWTSCEFERLKQKERNLQDRVISS